VLVNYFAELKTLAWEQNEGDGVLCWTNDAASYCSVFFSFAFFISWFASVRSHPV
jgi:hypothetical protein